MGSTKHTPLTWVHETLGARMIEFAGFTMPVSYTSIIEEHNAVRNAAGIFDVSHMGEFLVTGPNALDFVDHLVTNDCRKMKPGDVIYTVMCREDGSTVDDLLVYHLKNPGDPDFLLVVNAANIDKDYTHVSSLVPDGVQLTDVSDTFALIAVQGPASGEIIKECSFMSEGLSELETLGYYCHFPLEVDGAVFHVSRTGYTGELGYELYIPPKLAVRFWEDIMRAGEPHGLRPVGLAARDTLRFEASFCLYGHELDDTTSPLEAGLNWLVKLKKESFMGKDTLTMEKKERPKRKLIGLELEGRNIARQGFDVEVAGTEIGKVTSGSFSPTLQKSLCMALVENNPELPQEGFGVKIRGKTVPAECVPLPFYKSRAR